METKQRADAHAWDLFRSPCCGQLLQNCTAGLCCSGCSRAYPVADGIPVLLLSAAVSLCRDCGEEMEKDEMGGTSCPACRDSQQGEPK